MRKPDVFIVANARTTRAEHSILCSLRKPGAQQCDMTSYLPRRMNNHVASATAMYLEGGSMGEAHSNPMFVCVFF